VSQKLKLDVVCISACQGVKRHLHIASTESVRF
jgi:hypothetical protein